MNFQHYITSCVTTNTSLNVKVYFQCWHMHVHTWTNAGGVDYTALNHHNLSFPLGSETLTVDLEILDNERVEGKKSFLVQLSLTPQPEFVLGRSETVINIVNDDSKMQACYNSEHADMNHQHSIQK